LAVALANLIAKQFFPVHRAVKCGRYREFWLKGGRGSGKSSFIAIEIWLGMIRDEGANAAIYRKTALTMRQSVFAQMLWAADMLGIRKDIALTLAPLEIQYVPTGQRILFRGADDPGKSKSIKLADGEFRYLWFEELTDFAGMEDIRSIKASILRGGGDMTAFISYNPPACAAEWVNAEAVADVPGRFVHHSDYLGMPKKWLGKAFLADAAALKKSNERAYRHMYLGEVTGLGDQIFENLEIRPIAPAEMDGRVYCGLDFGFARDPDAFVKVVYDAKRNALYIFSEFVRAGTGADELAGELQKRLRADESVTCDSAEPRVMHTLRNCGIRALAAKKGPGSVREGMRFLQEMLRIVIDPAKCPVAAREFLRYTYPRDRTGQVLPEYPDRDNHTIDAVRYALESVTGLRKARTFRKEIMGF